MVHVTREVHVAQSWYLDNLQEMVQYQIILLCGLQCTLTFSTHLCNQRKAGVSGVSEVNIQTSNRCPLSWQLDIYIIATCMHQMQHLHTVVVHVFVVAVVQWVVVWSLH